MNANYTILEIGSGSFKLHQEGLFSTRFQSSLGKGLENNKLDPQSVKIALNSLQNQILPFLNEHRIDIRDVLVFATAALRQAMGDPDGSGTQFLDELKHFGIDRVKVLSEEEECRYAAQAILEELMEDYQDFLMLDTGGASHQLVEFKKARILRERSYPIGSHSDLSKVQLPQYTNHGFSKGLPMAVIGTSGLILNHTPNVNRNSLRQMAETIEPMPIEERRAFLELMVPEQHIQELFVDFRLAILPVAFRIISNCADKLEVPEFVDSTQQAMNYISKHGF